MTHPLRLVASTALLALFGTVVAAQQATVTSPDAARITVSARPFAPASPAAETVFVRKEGWEIGLDQPVEFSMEDMWPPFWEGRSLASGDLDRDGDLDLAISSTDVGLRLFVNDGAGQFSPMAIDLGPLEGAQVFNTAIVDLDGDGFRDLVLATYGDGNWIIPGTATGFGTPARVANTQDSRLTMAMSFADVNRDGALDMAFGNWASGWYRRVPGEESRNRVIWNTGGALPEALDGAEFTALPGIPGETLTMLFSDVDRDGWADLLVGNDFEIPDYLYLGGPEGLRQVTHGDDLLERTTTTTMAIKTADLMNDGTPEIYYAQIAGRDERASPVMRMQPIEQYCEGIKREADRATCQQNMAIKEWYRSGNSFDPNYANRCQQLSGAVQAECKAMLIKDLAIQRRDPGICALVPPGQDKARDYCTAHFLPVRAFSQAEADDGVEQILNFNVLLEPQDGRWRDVAKDWGLGIGGWAWDTKIADFDEDGWQDVYIVNGTWVPNDETPSNLFFRNTGTGFVEQSEPFGLTDYLMSAAAAQFDMDGDGDLDFVTYPVNGPLGVFINSTQGGNAVSFALEDHAGNRDGIGALLTVTDDAGITRTREVTLGGGFMAFDAPVIHVGLGAASSVERLHIRWADGTETEITGPLPSEQAYTITRAR